MFKLVTAFLQIITNCFVWFMLTVAGPIKLKFVDRKEIKLRNNFLTLSNWYFIRKKKKNAPIRNRKNKLEITGHYSECNEWVLHK